jgi:branched-chain amino acid transport system substrate-binding protein
VGKVIGIWQNDSKKRRFEMSKKISRRTFLKSAVVGLMACMAGVGFIGPTSAKAAQPLRILLGGAFSGPYAETGMHGNRAAALALEHFGGQVLGRPIELVERDISTPSDAVRKTKEAVEKLGVEYIVIGPSSAFALAVMEYANTKGVVMMASAASDKITGEACNKYTFRHVTPCWGGIREVVPRIIDEYGGETFYTITPKYVFGEDLLRNTKEVLQARGKKLVGNSYHPLGESEFSPYITKAMAAKPDWVLFLNFSGDTITALKQAANFGLGKVSRICACWGAGVSQMQAIGSEALKDVIFGSEYFYKIDSPMNNRLNEAYMRRYDMPSPFPAADTYASIYHYLKVVEKAGTTDPLKVIQAWEGFETDGLTGRETWRACDHQCIRNFYTLRCKGPEEMKNRWDFADIIGYSKNYLPCDQTGCNMP